MFTGIVEEIGVVSKRAGDELTVIAKVVLDGLNNGDSIAVDGACLTVSKFTNDGFTARVSPETFQRTTLSRLRVGDAINLERALAFGARLGGHLVQGHVDGVGRIVSVHPQGAFALWRFQAPADVARYLIPKGSVAIDGISLTVVEPERDTFGVALIPTTLEMTTLKNKRPGDAVNMEADMIGKHVFQYLKGLSGSGLSLEKLSRHGFT